MKKKFLVVLISLSIASLLVSGYVIYTIENTTRRLDTLIQLHQVALLREKMLDHIQVVQQDLNLKQTRYAMDLATLVSHVGTMSGTIDSCFDCHHNKEITAKLRGLHDSSEVYKNALSRVYTIRANATRLMKEEDNAFVIGEDLIEEVNNMLRLTNMNLGNRTQTAFRSINRSKNVLIVFTFLAPLIVIGVAVWFYRSFTRPISSVLEATAKLKTGDLDFRITGLKDEFGEVADSFNEMSRSLKEIMHNMMQAEQMVLMGEMASRLAHEIKNPITGIKLAAEIVRNEADLDAEHKDLITKAINQIKIIEKLMKSLLNFAKPSAPHLEMESLNSIIDNTFSTIEILVQERSRKGNKEDPIRLVKELDEKIPLIRTDASQVQQILLNLLLNAVDAMPKGGTLTVRSSRAPVEGFLRVDISDTGHGIDPQDAERIFQPFYSTKVKGSGLGLAIVRRLVDIHGGKVSLQSEEGAGTTFTVCLPIDPDEGIEKA